jgi:hypothetical protein
MDAVPMLRTKANKPAVIGQRFAEFATVLQVKPSYETSIGASLTLPGKL